MKINKIVVLVTIGVLLTATATGYAIYAHRNTANKEKPAVTHSADTGATKKSTSVDSSVNTPNKSAVGQGASTDTGSVDSPDNGAAYPIVNAHYKIDQQNPSTYDITLYAISNSPSQYDEYIAQLKQYKQEALAYLTGRYGDISKFTINWDPPNAKTL